MDLTANLVRLILFISNFVFVIIGLSLIVLGCINEFSDDIVFKIFDHTDFLLIGGFFIFLGVCIFVVTFFGCWGAYYEKYSMLYMYGILLSILLLLQLIFYGIAFYLYKQDSNDRFVKEATEKFFEKYYVSDANIVIDYTQSHYECCGVDGPDFWLKFGLIMPLSCCPNRICNNQNEYTKGCLGDIKEFIASKFRLSFIVCTLIIQIVVIGATFYLAREVRTNRDEYNVI